MRCFRWLLERSTVTVSSEESVSHVTPAGPTTWKATAVFAVLSLLPVVSLPWPVMALHKVDHRFTVEGHVCGLDGHPIEGAKVSVKDTRASVGTSAYTDDDGYYKATLHLHNENEGDPLLISVLDFEKKAKVDVDPDDIYTERKILVNPAHECAESMGSPPQWVYYGIGVGLVLAVGLAWLQTIRSRQNKRGRRPAGKSSKRKG